MIAFQKDKVRKLVLDHSFKIWDEYHNKMIRGQDYGSMVVSEKLQSARFVDIGFDADGHVRLPPELNKIDPSDRKFVAVALKDISNGDRSSIINAADSDWHECEKELQSVKILVQHLVKRESDKKKGDRTKSKSKGSVKDVRQKRPKR